MLTASVIQRKRVVFPLGKNSIASEAETGRKIRMESRWLVKVIGLKTMGCVVRDFQFRTTLLFKDTRNRKKI